MGQVTIYLDDETESKMRSAAKALKQPHSKWIANLIREKVQSEWPVSVRSLAGAWKDFPTAGEIRKSEGSDVEREKL